MVAALGYTAHVHGSGRFEERAASEVQGGVISGGGVVI